MFTFMRFTLPLLLLAMAVTWPEAQMGQASANDETAGNPAELGKVAWRRGFDEAIEEAKKNDKPLLVLFQEVPG